MAQAMNILPKWFGNNFVILEASAKTGNEVSTCFFALINEIRKRVVQESEKLAENKDLVKIETDMNHRRNAVTKAVKIKQTNPKCTLDVIQLASLLLTKQLDKIYWNSAVKLNPVLSVIKEVDLSKSELNFLPAKPFVFMTSLVRLNVSQNKLMTIPTEIFDNCQKLNHLNVSQNKLVVIPPHLVQLKNLEELLLNGNPAFDILPSEVKKQIKQKQMSSFYSYLNQMQKAQVEWRKMKLIFIGKARVGKTSLTKSLKAKNNKASKTNITNGIAIQDITINDIEFSCWDFGGQLEFYPTHQFFLTEKAIYLLVFNILNDDYLTLLEYWLKQLRAIGVPPVVLVGSHADKASKELIQQVQENLERKFIGSQYPHIRRKPNIFWPVSNKNGTGIKELIEFIGQVAGSLKFRQLQVPASYSKLHDLIESNNSLPYIEWNEYLQLCSSCSLQTEEEISSATEFLHNNGTLLHFDDPKHGLNRLVILQPQWLVDVLASVISFKSKINENGILAHSLLKMIWKKFPKDLHGTLLELLYKFEVAYPVLDKGEREPSKSIVPCLLPSKPPSNIDSKVPILNSKKSNIGGRVYKFDFLPLGFFSRFLNYVVHNPALECSVFWRNGGVLTLKDGDPKVMAASIEYSTVQNYYLVVVKFFTHPTMAKISEGIQIFRTLIEELEQIIECYYSNLKSSLERYIPCPHCLKENPDNPSLVDMQKCIDCLYEIDENRQTISFQCGQILRLSQVAPDIAFVDIKKLETVETGPKRGSGAFGIVFEGKLGKTKVAIKQIKQESTMIQQFNEFQREAYLMSLFDHLNIVKMFGIRSKKYKFFSLYLGIINFFFVFSFTT